MKSPQSSDALRDGLAVTRELAGGKPPDAASIATTAAALTALVELQGAAGELDKKAETSALLATALRIAAGLAAADRSAAYLHAHEHALKARDHAIAAAEQAGVNDLNLAAYVRATHEAAQCALAAGAADTSAEGTGLLAQAADHFAEAAAGFRRLGGAGDAQLAEVKALEARSRRALRA